MALKSEMTTDKLWDILQGPTTACALKDFDMVFPEDDASREIVIKGVTMGTFMDMISEKIRIRFYNFELKDDDEMMAIVAHDALFAAALLTSIMQGLYSVEEYHQYINTFCAAHGPKHMVHIHKSIMKLMLLEATGTLGKVKVSNEIIN